MRRILPAILLALWMLGSVALAEVCQGMTMAAFSVQVEADEAGVLAALNVAAGDRVSEGDVLGSFFTEKAFAAQDGTIVSISAAEGDDVDGDVLELAPVERYQIYCTVDGAYASAGTMLVHTGEQVYIKCTADGSHRGVGVIVQIDGDEFRVLTLGGTLYVGETADLYRNADFTSASRIGIGTAVASDVETYAASGTIARMHVSMGEYVERGELLFETGGGVIAAPSAGIVAAVSVQPGDSVAEGECLLTIVPQEAVCIEVCVDERIAASIAAGDRVGIVYTADPQERTETGVVEEISQVAGEGGYAVRIRPESVENLRLGMTAAVRFGGE